MAAWKNKLVRPSTWSLLDFSRKFSFSAVKVVHGRRPIAKIAISFVIREACRLNCNLGHKEKTLHLQKKAMSYALQVSIVSKRGGKKIANLVVYEVLFQYIISFAKNNSVMVYFEFGQGPNFF